MDAAAAAVVVVQRSKRISAGELVLSIFPHLREFPEGRWGLALHVNETCGEFFTV